MNFKNPYNRKDFLNFLEVFLTDFEPKIENISTNKNCKLTKQITKLGGSKSIDLSIYEIEHFSENDPRVSISREAFKFLREYYVDKALVLFRNKKSENYRFSFITFNTIWDSGKKIKTEFSNPRRFSFFLGPKAKVNTPTKFLISKGSIKNLDDLKNRFSLEVVNKEFYKEIAGAFNKLVSGLLKLPSTEDRSQISLEFAVRLIGRIIFCWFLREKQSEAGASLISKEILSLNAVEQNEDYYHKLLEPIFFEVLNKPIDSRKDEFSKKPFLLVPYLNGGLFSPQHDDFYKRLNGDLQSQFHNTLIVPDKWFLELFETLETYNFTIDENTGYDEELSIDPEMLGRIFENLLAEINPDTGESARKSTGSYYTPRTIVNYMVDESLLLYLKDKTSIEEEKLRALISYNLLDDLEKPLTEIEKEKIVNALGRVKILDPACGSGAFPIGALQKIVFILQQIDPNTKLWFQKQIEKTAPELRRTFEKEFENKNFDYIRKLGVIRENIYGVDIQPIATEIARLRCFLTLIVDEQIEEELENRGIEPLPNLDFKFVTANSLINIPKTQQSTIQSTLFDNYEKIDELKKIRDQYLTSSGLEREQLRSEFSKLQKDLIYELIQEHGLMSVFKAELTQKLTEWEPFSNKPTSWFDSEWMFGIKNGFDVIIANPPYINISNLNKKDRELYKKTFSVTKNKVDVYAYFIERGVGLLKPSGILTYITPHTWKATISFLKLRELIFQNCEVLAIINLNYGAFDATVKPLILVLKNDKKSSYKIKILDENFRHNYLIDSTEITFNKDMLIDTTSSSIEKSIFKKIEANSMKLEDLCKFTRGIKTSNDTRFIKKEAINNEYKKVIRGKNINKYNYVWTGEYVWYRPDLMREKVGCLPHTSDLFEVSEKLILQRVSKGLVGCYDSQQIYALDTCLISDRSTLVSNVSIKFLLAMINSKLLNFWYHKKFSLPTVSGYELHQLPIKIKQQENLKEIVDKILLIASSEDYSKNKAAIIGYEKQINEIIYEIYGLTEDEVRIIEANENNDLNKSI